MLKNIIIIIIVIILGCDTKKDNKVIETKLTISKTEEIKIPTIDTMWVESINKLTKKELDLDIAFIKKFLNTLQSNNFLSLENYFEYFDISTEYEENCFYQLCCEHNMPDRNKTCYDIYSNRMIKKRNTVNSYFLQTLKQKLFFFKKIKDIKYIGSFGNSNIYVISDDSKNIVHITVGMVDKNVRSIGYIYDRNKLSLLNFIKPTVCN